VNSKLFQSRGELLVIERRITRVLCLLFKENPKKFVISPIDSCLDLIPEMQNRQPFLLMSVDC
jgi:hypothetical protein